MSTYRPRSSLAITFSVWRALFLREAVARMFGRRAAWVWLILEPAAHIAFFVFIYTVLRVRHIGGVDTRLWVIAGMLAFFLFRRVGTQGASAIGANLALFAYPHVKPADTVLVRCVLEAFIMVIISAVVLAVARLAGMPLLIDDPLSVVAAVGGLWLLGTGYGLTLSVANELTPELANLIGVLLIPLYFFSGVMFPPSALPAHYRDWMMFNPVTHGVEAVRAGLANYYHPTTGTSLAYLYFWGLALVFTGLALQVRHKRRLVAL